MENSAGTNGKKRAHPAVVTAPVAPEHQPPRELISDRPSGLRQVAAKIPVAPNTLPPVADMSVHDTIPAPPWHDGMDDSPELVLGESDV